MRALLAAIRSEIQQALPFVRAGDVFITEDELLLPAAVMFPAVGVKDGSITHTLDSKSEILQDLRVRLSAYARVFKPEESVMGEAGVLRMVADITARLMENNLDLAGVYHAFPVAEEASQTFGDEEEMIQRKTIEFQFLRRVPRSA